jgi:hypothetical protein
MKARVELNRHLEQEKKRLGLKQHLPLSFILDLSVVDPVVMQKLKDLNIPVVPVDPTDLGDTRRVLSRSPSPPPPKRKKSEMVEGVAEIFSSSSAVELISVPSSSNLSGKSQGRSDSNTATNITDCNRWIP